MRRPQITGLLVLLGILLLLFFLWWVLRGSGNLWLSGLFGNWGTSGAVGLDALFGSANEVAVNAANSGNGALEGGINAIDTQPRGNGQPAANIANASIGDLPLSWDLVLTAAFIVLFAYNFILGQNSTLKLILSTYIAVLTSDAIATFIKQYFFDMSSGWNALTDSVYADNIFAITRLLLFLFAIVIFVVRGAFHIGVEKHDHWVARTAIHGVFAALSAGLFLSTVLIYLSGNSFVEGMLYSTSISIYNQSWFARMLIDHYQFWFSMPAMAFLITSFFFDPEY